MRWVNDVCWTLATWVAASMVACALWDTVRWRLGHRFPDPTWRLLVFPLYALHSVREERAGRAAAEVVHQTLEDTVPSPLEDGTGGAWIAKCSCGWEETGVYDDDPEAEPEALRTAHYAGIIHRGEKQRAAERWL